jgi:CRISPR/Cas system CMR-associated protein Cmr5 small subunit
MLGHEGLYPTITVFKNKVNMCDTSQRIAVTQPESITFLCNSHVKNNLAGRL